MMMNRCGYQQQQQKMNALVGYGGEMRMGDSSFDGVVCPKPRRLGLFIPSVSDQIRPSRLHQQYQNHPINHHTEAWESRTGTEIEIILTKGRYVVEKSNPQVASSPPFFCGSPPSRASNPVVQDARFGNDKLNPLSPVLKVSPPTSTYKNGGFAHVKYGHKPAMRIEGFNCQGISAVA